jgi:predicted dehydrogenase
MLANEALDGIVIATPHATHYQLAKDSLAQGLHVLVEKPMVLYATHAQELVGLAAQQGRELVIGYPWHYGLHARRARELIESGELGAVQYINCTFSSHIIELLRGHDDSTRSEVYPVHGPGAVYSQPHLSGGGMGHLQITHSAGLLFFVTQLRARRVHALMRNHDLPLDLVDAITVEFEGGALGTVGGTGNGGPDGYANQVDSIMNRLMSLPHETRIHPGHTLPSTIGDEWERNPFVRIWRGLDEEGSEPCRVRGREATLILFGPDYDGTHKAWVRYPDGRDAIVGGSQIER